VEFHHSRLCICGDRVCGAKKRRRPRIGSSIPLNQKIYPIRRPLTRKQDWFLVESIWLPFGEVHQIMGMAMFRELDPLPR